MKMIANNIGTISMAKVVKEALFGSWETANNCHFDVYAEDDGTIRVYKHKISFDEAKQIAGDWLERNICPTNKNISFCITLPDVIVCTDITCGKVKIGAARFNEKDEHYATCIGKALAYSRAIGKPLPDDLAAYLGIKQ